MGLVRPRTLRPVSGVCARVDSFPVPPRVTRFADFAEAPAFARPFALARFGEVFDA